MNLPKDIAIVDNGNEHYGIAICRKITNYEIIDLIQGFSFNKIICNLFHTIVSNDNNFYYYLDQLVRLWGNKKKISFDEVQLYISFARCSSKNDCIKAIQSFFDVDECQILTGLAPFLFNCDVDIPEGYLPIGLMTEGILRDSEQKRYFEPHYFLEILPSQRGNNYMDLLRDAWGKKYEYKASLYEVNLMNSNFLMKKGYKLDLDSWRNDFEISQQYQKIKQIITGSNLTADDVLKVIQAKSFLLKTDL